MPHKIGFTVIYASGEDERHRASELNVHGPTVRGWQSPQDCSYPQDLVLQLHRPAAVHRIQVLSHHFLIPEKVELWLGEDCGTDPDELEVENDRPVSPSSVRFEYLGFITLSDNCATEYKSRELKSVTVPGARARFVKLRLHRNHRNAHNPHNQVSLIAVNIIGIADDLGFVNNMNGSGDSSLLLLNNPQYTSPYDDLAFEMYVDPEVATLIRSMEIKKHKAVLGERFEYARKLKVAMIELRAAGEALAKLELEKRRAIAREDFDRAKDKKAHMDRYRSAVYACLDVDSLLEINGLQTKNDDSRVELLKVPTAAASATGTATGIPSAPSGVCRTSPVHATGLTTETTTSTTSTNTSSTTVTARAASPDRSPPPQQHHHHHHSHQHGTPLHHAPSSHHQATSCEFRRTSPSTSPTGGHQAHSTPAHRTGSLRRRGGSCGGTIYSGTTSAKAPSPAKTSYEAYEERTLPALRHCHTTSHRDFNLEVNDLSIRSKLSEREKKQAALPISVFGNDLVEKFYSKQFCDKEEGLRTLMSALEAQMAGEACPAKGPANKVARAAVHLLHRALRDKVFSVYSLAAHAIRLFFTQFVPARVSPAEVGRSVDRLLPDLLSKSGDPTPRIHNMAVHTILTMADCQEVKELHVIPVLLTRPLTSSTHPRLALSRLEMVEQLVLSHGISQDKHSGLTCRILSELGAAGLHHPAEGVRKVAERILVLVYRVNPRLVRKQLPPDDDITRRNLLYRQLFHEFDKLDIERKNEILERNAMQSSNSSGIAMSQSATCLQASASLVGHPPPASLMSSSLGTAIANANSSTTASKSPPASSSSSASIITSPSDISHHDESGIALSASIKSNETSRDRICIFCQNKTENFNEEGLNIHYWRSCPMLMRCHNCKQVVEIAAFARHLANECEKSDEYRMCQKCKLAISSTSYDLHITTCNVGDGVIKCPLCQTEIQGTLEASWRYHLMVLPCPKHPRRKHLKTRSHSPSDKP